MANKTNTWQPNTNQQKFLDTLKENDGLTLVELSKIANFDFKTGSVNPLITKGLVKTEDTDIECQIVRVDNGMVIGHTKKKVKKYSLVKGD